MSVALCKVVGTLALVGLVAGCASTTQVVGRNVTAVAAGGPSEVWVVMGETATDVTGGTSTLRRDGYAIYHCVPQGCKRVGELTGTQAFKE